MSILTQGVLHNSKVWQECVTNPAVSAVVSVAATNTLQVTAGHNRRLRTVAVASTVGTALRHYTQHQRPTTLKLHRFMTSSGVFIFESTYQCSRHAEEKHI